MTRDLVNVAASVRDRLFNLARDRDEDFQFVLRRYAVERFLYRLGRSEHSDRFILKGAMLFALWGGSAYRPTRDLDLAGFGDSSADAVLSAVRSICDVSVKDDGLVFDVSSISADPTRLDAEYDGLRVKFVAMLGNARIPMQIDIGFGDAIEPPAGEVDYPTLLGGPSPRIRAYPREAVVAEKFQAAVALGAQNTRYKDFYDLISLAGQFAFDGSQLAAAIQATFERRNTAIGEAIPAALTPAFYSDADRSDAWRAYVTRSTLPAAPADFVAVGERIQAFLLSLWRTLADGGAFELSWPEGGPWEATA